MRELLGKSRSVRLKQKFIYLGLFFIEINKHFKNI